MEQSAAADSSAAPDLATTVTIEQDDTEPGGPNTPTVIASATIPPLSLRVFRLGPREVDGSPPGKFNAGTATMSLTVRLGKLCATADPPPVRLSTCTGT